MRVLPCLEQRDEMREPFWISPYLLLSLHQHFSPFAVLGCSGEVEETDRPLSSSSLAEKELSTWILVVWNVILLVQSQFL